MKKSLTTFLHQQCFKTTTACLLILFAVASGHADQSPHWALSPTPPLGWNSYDAFGDSVTEQEILINAEFVKEKLLIVPTLDSDSSEYLSFCGIKFNDFLHNH